VARYEAQAPGLSLALLGDELAWRGALLEQLRVTHYDAELVYAAEQSDDPAVRLELDVAEAELRAELIASRQMFAGNFGEAEATRAGLSSRTPEGGLLLVAFADNYLKALRDEPVRTSLYGMSMDLAVNIQRVEAPLARLSSALDAHSREARELQEAKLNRDRAQEALRDAYVQLATYYESLFRMAGLGELADRLRPTARRAASVERPPADPIAIDPSA
jgi:hypothetical protein